MDTKVTALQNDKRTKIFTDNNSMNSSLIVDLSANNTNQRLKQPKVKNSSSSFDSFNKSEKFKNINKTYQDRKDYQKKVDILVNRINRLKKVEEEATKRLNNLKQKIIKEETTKIFKKNVKEEIVKAKSQSMDHIELRKEEIKRSKSKDKVMLKERKDLTLKVNQTQYADSVRNRQLISVLLTSVHDEENKIKTHNYHKQKDYSNKLKMNKKIKDLEMEEERKQNYLNKIKIITTEAEEQKLHFSQLEAEEHEIMKRITQTINKQEYDLEKIRQGV